MVAISAEAGLKSSVCLRVRSQLIVLRPLNKVVLSIAIRKLLETCPSNSCNTHLHTLYCILIVSDLTTMFRSVLHDCVHVQREKVNESAFIPLLVTQKHAA